MGISICMVGVGAFAQSFIPLFKAHPLVDAISLCDLDERKLRENSQRYGIPRTYASLDEACDSDVDAVAIITQNWMHAEQAIQALNACKHVYSAVPTGITVDEVVRLVRTVENTGKVYMLGETSYYYPAVIYCREQFRKGAFGRVVYGEGEYYHDWDHGLYDVMKWRGGERWREFAGGPPMHYPTHSTSQIISVTGARMTHVSCCGFVDMHDDGIFDPAVNRWGNPFSNESALFHMSDGSACRINEFRRIGHPGTVRMTLFGTEGSYEENWAGKAWVTKNPSDCIRLDDLLACSGVPALPEKNGMGVVTSQDGTHLHASKVHDVARLPRQFIGLPNGHCGSHQFLVDDFVRACANRTVPPNNVWQAARYALPGIIAHESAMQGGVLLEVPDCGDPPREG
ncbi:MAG TPA: Gfo/Idh/MocA family oxidoreductase [Candidatus Latescibacteria bacterium]|nr:Gfo/Idh/MocA family oxidoreductase [Candidatus Latescibacterota bacterium]